MTVANVHCTVFLLWYPPLPLPLLPLLLPLHHLPHALLFPFPYQHVVLTSEERVAAAKAAASRLAAKLPSQQLSAAQPQGEPAKQQALQDKRKLLWGSKKKEVSNRRQLIG